MTQDRIASEINKVLANMTGVLGLDPFINKADAIMGFLADQLKQLERKLIIKTS